MEDALILGELHVYQDDELRSAAMNMAIDEALLEAASAPSLRFYGWRRLAISFGYFNRFADVAAEEGKRELIRRWTGGGIVYHGEDLTYSFVLPARSGRTLPPSREVYAHVHEAIRRALPAGIAASLATRDAPKISDACFANAVAADVLVDGRKIAGAAQRRARIGLLQQGSIQHPAATQEFRAAFARTLCPKFELRRFGSDLLARAEELAAGKYARDEWLRQR